MKETRTENIIALLIILFLVIAITVYFYLPYDLIANFVAYLSAYATVGILILTSFYVVYTNRQIKELQKQRQLQIQPLPNHEIVEAEVPHPRLCWWHENGSISFRADLLFKINLKNIVCTVKENRFHLSISVFRETSILKLLR